GSLPSQDRQAEIVAAIHDNMADQAAAAKTEAAKRAEKREQLDYVDAGRASGHVIDIPGIARVVPGDDANIVYLAVNGDSARILKYDLDTDTTRSEERRVGNDGRQRR